MTVSNAALHRRLQTLFHSYQLMNTFMNCGAKEIRVVSADHARYRAEMEISPDMVNPMNMLHGGCSATLIDVGCAAAAFVRGHAVFSINQEITVVSSALLDETIYMDIELVRLGKTQCFARGQLARKRDDQLIVFGNCTYTVPPKRILTEAANSIISQLTQLH